jgi:hypothetical protein
MGNFLSDQLSKVGRWFFHQKDGTVKGEAEFQDAKPAIISVADTLESVIIPPNIKAVLDAAGHTHDAAGVAAFVAAGINLSPKLTDRQKADASAFASLLITHAHTPADIWQMLVPSLQAVVSAEFSKITLSGQNNLAYYEGKLKDALDRALHTTLGTVLLFSPVTAQVIGDFDAWLTASTATGAADVQAAAKILLAGAAKYVNDWLANVKIGGAA